MKKMKQVFSLDRSRITALIGVGAIVLLFGLNLLLMGLGQTHSLYVDMTYEELYTPTDRLEQACDTALLTPLEDGTLPEVKAIFCADPDTLNDSIVSRVTYLLLLKLQQRYDNFTVETVNVATDPTAVAQYKTTSQMSIAPTDVILAYGTKHRVLALESFWTLSSDDTYFSYSGEYRFASALYSLLSVSRPTAYFLTGHGETVYETDPDGDTSGNERTGAFYELLLDRGLQVKTLNLSEVQAVPDDCVLLILNDPQTDFTYDASSLGSLSYVSDLEKIDRYLVERQGAMMVAKDYAIHLPELQTYLREWGFVFSDSLVKDTQNHVATEDGAPTHIVVAYDTDTSSYGYSIYGSISSISSAAATVIPDTGYLTPSFRNGATRFEDGSSALRVFAPFLSTHTSAQAFAYDSESGDYTAVATDKTAHVLAATGSRIYTDDYTSEEAFSYVFCAASGDFFSSEYIGRASYANYDVLSLLVENISRVDVYADIDLGGESLNSKYAYGKILISEDMAETSETIYAMDGSKIKTNEPLSTVSRSFFVVLIAAVPTAILVVGVVIFVRRRFL